MKYLRLATPTLIVALLAATAYAFTRTDPRTCATVQRFPGTFHTAHSTTPRQAAEGIALLALHERNYHFTQDGLDRALLTGDGFAIAVRTAVPGRHQILGLIATFPAGCTDSEGAKRLLHTTALAFLR